MKQKTGKRRQSVTMFLLSLLMVFALLARIDVQAAQYHAGADGDTFQYGSSVLPGDQIGYRYDEKWDELNQIAGLNISYYDRNGAFLSTDEIRVEKDKIGKENSFIVKEYTGTAIAKEEFKDWKVTEIQISEEGCLTQVGFRARSKKDYNIIYELNGGRNDGRNPDTYEAGVGVEKFEAPDKYIIQENPRTVVYLQFEGWYSDPEFTEPVDSIPPTAEGDKTLYAKFAGDTYKITYELDGGTVYIPNPETYTNGVGLPKGSFHDADKEYHRFTGWYKKTAAGEVKVEQIPADWAGDLTLYARYEPDEYKITYELDGGTNGAGNPDKYTGGVGVESFADASKAGHTFVGWFLRGPEGTGEEEKITRIPESMHLDLTLYAKFAVSEYPITYVLDGGTNGAGNPDKYTYGAGVAAFADASKEGHQFDGWYETADFSGARLEKIADTEHRAVTLYAKFVKSDDSTKQGEPTKEEKFKNEIDINAKIRVAPVGSRFSLRWGKVSGADGYEVYATSAYGKYPKKATVSTKGNKTSAKIKKINGKKIGEKSAYKFYVRAYKLVNGEKVTLAESIPVFSISKKNTKYSTTKHTRVEPKNLSLKSGGSGKIKGKTILFSSKKKALTKVPVKEFRFESTDKNVATVDAKGNVKAVGQGVCFVWVYARDGNAQRVKITVK